jgi:hypothetical protein
VTDAFVPGRNHLVAVTALVLPHYSPLAPVIGLAVLAIVIIALAVALARGSRRR